MALKTNKTISSPLVSAFNNIVSINRSGSTIKSTQQSYQGFLRFMDVEIKNIEAIELPKKSKIRSLSNLNVAATFGSAGSLLSGLASGALDAAGLVGNFFGGGGKGGKKPGKPNPKAGRAIPKGKGVRLGGIRALGIVNAVFAGLDIAQGISEGESVGKASAGAGGALAGSIIGAALGSIGGPLGSIAGSMAGNFVGGYLGDRAYETVTGTGEQGLKSKQKEKLKAQEVKQKASAQLSSGLTMGSVLDKFDSVVSKFERMQPGTSASETETSSMGTSSGEKYGENVDPNNTKKQNNMPSGEDVTLDGEGTFIQGSTGRSTGPHFHIGPTELYDPVGDKWVDRRTEQGKKDAREAAFKVAKTLMQRKKYFRFTNAGIDVNPGSKLDDATLMKYVEREQSAHAGRNGGGSWGGLDIAGSPGLRMPLPVGDVVSSVHGFGNSARILGTKAFVGHGMAGSKKTTDAKIRRSSTSSSNSGRPTAVLSAGTNDYKDPKTAKANIEKSIKELQAKGYNVVVVPPSEQGEYAEVSKAVQEAATGTGATIEKGQYDKKDPTRPYTHLTGPEQTRIGEKYKGALHVGDSNSSGINKGDVSGRIKTGAGTAEILKFIKDIPKVAPSSRLQAVPSMQPTIAATPMKPPSMQMQQYPTYNQQQSTTTIIPMMMSTGGGGGQQKPMVISTGGGSGGGQTIVLPGPSSSQVLNSLFKTMLLTNLSGT